MHRFASTHATNHNRHERLGVFASYLAVQPKCKQHEEEEKWPECWYRHTSQCFWVSHEGKSWTWSEKFLSIIGQQIYGGTRIICFVRILILITVVSLVLLILNKKTNKVKHNFARLLMISHKICNWFLKPIVKIEMIVLTSYTWIW